MQPTHLIPILTTILPLTTASHIGPNDPLQPWEITRLRTFSPSGRPGDSPYSTINLTIADPNEILAGNTDGGTTVAFPPNSANCSAQFTRDSPPWDKTYPCAEQSWQYGSWSFEMLKPETNGTFYGYVSPTEYFDIRFTHRDSIEPHYNINYTQVFVGTARFEVGVNMEGVCGGSGICSWGIKAGAGPVLVNQTRTECRGLCA